MGRAGRVGIERSSLMPSPRFHKSAFKHEDVAMSAKKPAADEKEATTIVGQ